MADENENQTTTPEGDEEKRVDTPVENEPEGFTGNASDPIPQESGNRPSWLDKYLPKNKKTLIIIGMVLALMAFIGIIASGSSDTEDEVAEETAVPCKLYVDTSYDANILLNKYKVDVYLDDQKIGTVANGDRHTVLVDTEQGSHSLTYYKQGDSNVSGSKDFDLTADSTITAEISSESDYVEILSFDVTEGITDNALKVGDYTGMNLDDAIQSASRDGFTNIGYTSEGDSSIYVTGNWVVTGQNVKPGAQQDKNDQLVFTCVKTDTYLTRMLQGKTLPEAEDIIRKWNYSSVAYWDNSTDQQIPRPDQKEENDWIVSRAEDETEDEKIIWIWLSYKGQGDTETTTAEETTAAESTEEGSTEADSTEAETTEQETTAAAGTRSSEDILNETLDEYVAWEAVNSYGRGVYPYGFTAHYILGKLAAKAENGTTWFLKASCTIENEYGNEKDGTVEAEVTGTNDNPQVTYFITY